MCVYLTAQTGEKSQWPKPLCTYYRHTRWFSDYLHFLYSYGLKNSHYLEKTTTPRVSANICFASNTSPWDRRIWRLFFFFFFWLVKKGNFFQYSGYHGKTWYLPWLVLDRSSSYKRRVSNSTCLKMPGIRTPISWRQSVYQFCTCLTVVLTGFNFRFKHLSSNKNDAVTKLVRLKKNVTKYRSQSYRLLVPIHRYSNLSVLTI